jgi:hypothetical protein
MCEEGKMSVKKASLAASTRSAMTTPLISTDLGGSELIGRPVMLGEIADDLQIRTRYAFAF